MPALSVLDRTGDTKIEWTPGNAAEVEVARAAFDAAKKKGMLTYKRVAGAEDEVIHEFDPEAAVIVAAPPTVGG